MWDEAHREANDDAYEFERLWALREEEQEEEEQEEEEQEEEDE